MDNFFSSLWNQIKGFFQSLTSKERRRLAVLAVFVVLLSVATAYLLGRVEYGVLYSGLKPAEAGQMLTALEELGVPTKTQGSDTILVPADRVSDLRMRLSSQGFQSGNFDYSIFGNASGFGTTDLEKNTYLQFQLQANLRETILKMNMIQDCLVLVNLPQESSFVLSSDRQPATASVMLQVKGGQTLSNTEARTIAEMVSMGVPGLRTENIRIVDSSAHLYTINGEESVAGGITAQLALQRDMQERLQQQVVNLLTPVYGAPAIKAVVNVTLNFDDERVEDIKFAPPIEGETSGMVVSMQELYESSRYGNDAAGIPGTDSNGMGTVTYPYDGLDEDEIYNKVLREMNFELNQTKTELIKAKGSIRTLSVAVLIDSEAIDEDYTASVRNLVAQAIGVNDSYISVERLPFQVTASEIENQLTQQRDFMNAMRRQDFIKFLLKGLVVVLLAFMIFRLLQAILAAVMVRKQMIYATATGAPGSAVDYLAEGSDPLRPSYPDVDLTSKSEGIAQLEKFIDKDPGAVAQLLRNWLTDDFR